MSAAAQFPNLPREVLSRLPSFRSLVEGELLTTSIADADGALPMLDDYAPGEAATMLGLPTGPSGGFLLNEPGVYEAVLESFCLQPGAARPRSGGEGYVSAPLKGRGADLIGAILRGVSDHPEVTQQDVQKLLWALLARTPLDSMDEPTRVAARTLLTPRQIARADGAAVARIPAEAREALFARADPALRRVLDAEAAIRDRLLDGAATFDELEAIAVPDSREGNPAEKAPGHWSYHARGYFVRYFSDHYMSTQMVVSRPSPVDVKRDSLGRISRVSRANAWIEIHYDERAGGRTTPRDHRVAGFRIAAAHLHRMSSAMSARSDDATVSGGWTFSTVALPVSDPSIGEYVDWQKRLTEDDALGQQLNEFDRTWNRSGKAALKGSVTQALDLLRLRRALKLAASSKSVETWVPDHLDLLAEAFQFAVCTAAGGCSMFPERRSARIASLSAYFLPPAMGLQDDASGNPEADPSSDVSVPTDTGKQRLGKSNRPKKCPTPEDIAKMQKDIEFDELAQQLLRNYINSALPDGYANDADGLERWLKNQLEAATGSTIVSDGTATGTNEGSGCHTLSEACGPDPTVACEAIHSSCQAHEGQHQKEFFDRRQTADKLKGKEAAEYELRAYARGESYLKKLMDNMKQRCRTQGVPIGVASTWNGIRSGRAH